MFRRLSVVLLLVVSLSASAGPNNPRDRERNDDSFLTRIIRVIARITRPFDEITVPKP